MTTGKVKWFSDAKGYGFIQADEEELNTRDIFVHYSEITKEGFRAGFRTLVSGQPVRFELTDTPKGLQAKKVELLS